MPTKKRAREDSKRVANAIARLLIKHRWSCDDGTATFTEWTAQSLASHLEPTIHRTLRTKPKRGNK